MILNLNALNYVCEYVKTIAGRYTYCMQNIGKTVFFQYFFTKRPIKRSVQLGPTNFWYVWVELGLVLNALATVCGKSW